MPGQGRPVTRKDRENLKRQLEDGSPQADKLLTSLLNYKWKPIGSNLFTGQYGAGKKRFWGRNRSLANWMVTAAEAEAEGKPWPTPPAWITQALNQPPRFPKKTGGDEYPPAGRPPGLGKGPVGSGMTLLGKELFGVNIYPPDNPPPPPPRRGN